MSNLDARLEKIEERFIDQINPCETGPYSRKNYLQSDIPFLLSVIEELSKHLKGPEHGCESYCDLFEHLDDLAKE